jgi:hypothetical protein
MLGGHAVVETSAHACNRPAQKETNEIVGMVCGGNGTGCGQAAQGLPGT